MSDRATVYDRRYAVADATEERQAMVPEGPLSKARQTELPRDTSGRLETSVHPIVGEIAVAAAVWFIAVIWFSFSGGGGDVGLPLAIVTLFFVIFFGLFLLTASYTWGDPRWRLPQMSFREFLRSKVGTETGTMRGREVLIEIALIPTALAVAATVIGLVWVVLR